MCVRPNGEKVGCRVIECVTTLGARVTIEACHSPLIASDDALKCVSERNHVITHWRTHHR